MISLQFQIKTIIRLVNFNRIHIWHIHGNKLTATTNPKLIEMKGSDVSKGQSVTNSRKRM